MDIQCFVRVVVVNKSLSRMESTVNDYGTNDETYTAFEYILVFLG